MKLHGRLHYAPVKNPKKVVDVGTGNGNWAIDFAERHPDSQVLGIDLHFLSPQRVVPDNCSFDVASAEGHWDFLDGDKVDFVFLRYLGWLADWETIFAATYDNLQPGGWIESQEWVLNVECTNKSLKGTALRLERLGKTAFHACTFKSILQQLGFQNITYRRVFVPINAWHPEKRYKEIGELNLQSELAAAAPISHAALQEGLGWSQAEVDELVEDVKCDLQNIALQAYTPILIVTAQKPPGTDAHRDSITTHALVECLDSESESGSEASESSCSSSAGSRTPGNMPPPFKFKWGVENSIK